MKVMRFNPLWIFWFVFSLLLQIIGAVVMANMYNLKFFPYFIVIINFIFIIYWFSVPIKIKQNGGKK